ncbi:MAG: tRNA dihydrouridine(16) synthase DusC [Nevskiaceae bacterium]|nr:MAG: tRNA dihydrouridine(16) synthase DusC [Nevskiaceae bacterium]
MQLALAPMEGLVDDILRDVLTRVGGIDWCVTEFIRVSERLLPEHVFLKLAPELRRGARTRAGTPMRVQLLGSDPACLADNAALACTLGAPVIDLNFGCPAKTVNKSRGGAVLLKEPELLHRIVAAVRAAVPAEIPVTAKMRLGFDNTDRAFDCAQALADGGAAQIVVHARTKVDGYRPPAHWEWVARIQDCVRVPVYANGEIWSLDDWRRCRAVSGVDNIMLGRGLVARPDLARQIVAAREGRLLLPMTWADLWPLLQDFWCQVRAKLPPAFAPGRLKQWLIWLSRHEPQAAALFARIRRENDCAVIDALLGVSIVAGVPDLLAERSGDGTRSRAVA